MNILKDKILADVAEDLSEIEIALSSNLKPYFDLVSKVAGHILFAGGKCLRPLLMVLSSKLCGYESYDRFKYSTIFEYLHTATLLHDDVIDSADIRRGAVVANRLWGNPTALLVGDFLLARSISTGVATGKCSIIDVIADVAEKMSQGEIRQLEKKKDFSLTEKEYLEIISCKTAMMFRGACRAGALLGCDNTRIIEALSQYGYALGMAFQMADDMLDYANDSTNTGKKVGADLREGKITMPVIFAISQASRDDRTRMCDIISNETFSRSEFKWFVNTLEKYGAMEYTWHKALKYVKRAKNSLQVFEKNAITCTLIDIADYVLVRKG